MAERATRAFMDELGRGASRPEAMKVALESVEATFEQKVANEQVRLLRQEGVCPTCGAESGPEHLSDIYHGR